MTIILLFFMRGSDKPFAREAEKASIARPTPIQALLKINSVKKGHLGYNDCNIITLLAVAVNFYADVVKV